MQKEPVAINLRVHRKHSHELRCSPERKAAEDAIPKAGTLRVILAEPLHENGQQSCYKCFLWKLSTTSLRHEVPALAVEGIVGSNKTYPESSIKHLAHLVNSWELPLRLYEYVAQNLHVIATWTGFSAVAPQGIEAP